MEISSFKKHYEKIGIDPPVFHFVLGSGFSSLVDSVKKESLFRNWEEKSSLSFKAVPGMPIPGAASHEGRYRYFLHHTGSAIILQSGRVHAYEGHRAQELVQPVIGPFLAGTKNFILSNISGALKREDKIGTVIALKDHVNRTGLSPLVAYELKNERGEVLGESFPDMSAVYDKKMREDISLEISLRGIKVKEGVYIGLLGPELETPSEIEWLNRSSGGLFDAVGLSTVLEVIALKQAKALVSAFSLISNPAAGVDPDYKELSSKDMLAAVQPYAKKMIEAFFLYSEKKFKEQRIGDWKSSNQ